MGDPQEERRAVCEPLEHRVQHGECQSHSRTLKPQRLSRNRYPRRWKVIGRLPENHPEERHGDENRTVPARLAENAPSDRVEPEDERPD